MKGKCFGEPAEASRVGRMWAGLRAAFGLQKNDASPRSKLRSGDVLSLGALRSCSDRSPDSLSFTPIVDRSFECVGCAAILHNVLMQPAGFKSASRTPCSSEELHKITLCKLAWEGFGWRIFLLHSSKPKLHLLKRRYAAL